MREHGAADELSISTPLTLYGQRTQPRSIQPHITASRTVPRRLPRLQTSKLRMCVGATFVLERGSPCFRSHLPSTSCAHSCSPFLPARPQAWASQRWRSPSFSLSGVPCDFGGKLEISDLGRRKRGIDRILFVHNGLGNSEACLADSSVCKSGPVRYSDPAEVNSQRPQGRELVDPPVEVSTSGALGEVPSGARPQPPLLREGGMRD